MSKEKNNEISEILQNLYNSKNFTQITKLVLSLQQNNDNLIKKNQEFESNYITLEEYVKTLEDELKLKSEKTSAAKKYVKTLEEQGPKYYDSRL